VKKIKLLVVKYFFNLLYILFTVFCSYDRDLVTFVSNRDTELYGGLKNMYKAFEENGDYKTRILTFRFERSFKGRILYMYHSIQGLYYLAKSGIFVVDDYFLPLHCVTKNERNFVVQIWHAIGHLKKFGLSVKKNRTDVIKPHKNYDLAVVNADEDIVFFAEAFGMALENVKALGNPKCDSIINQRITHSKGSRTKVLYAPTYRTGSSDFSLSLIETFIRVFSDQVEEYDITISLHPYVRLNQSKYPENITFIQDGNKLESMLEHFDLLITDYSSILFDFVFFEKKIVLFTPDIKQYKEETGFYVDFEEYLKFPNYQDFNELKADLPHILTDKKINLTAKDLKKSTYKYVDGKNAQRVVNYLQEIKR